MSERASEPRLGNTSNCSHEQASLSFSRAPLALFTGVPFGDGGVGGEWGLAIALAALVFSFHYACSPAPIPVYVFRRSTPILS